jgi:glycosyltransferase involved in cell wall biosynthesis
VIYVDSGSTDGSVAMARSMGVEVVELATGGGFTAARARNAGFERLMQVSPTIDFVQFVDGDCEVDSGWLESAVWTLGVRSEVAVVCGRRRERFPSASIYNRLCDLEWDTQPGEATECGGDAMMRVSAFAAVNGYDASLIAGEEPELCVRLRMAGWKILRLDLEMTLHDAAMTRFGQWWRRNVRAGYAFAEGAMLHGKSSTQHWVRQANRNWVWGLILPLVALSLAWPTRGISIAAAMAAYLLITVKVYKWRAKLGDASSDSANYAIFCTLSKFPQVQGQLRYYAGRLLRRRSALIEYKTTAQPQPS